MPNEEAYASKKKPQKRTSKRTSKRASKPTDMAAIASDDKFYLLPLHYLRSLLTRYPMPQEGHLQLIRCVVTGEEPPRSVDKAQIESYQRLFEALHDQEADILLPLLTGGIKASSTPPCATSTLISPPEFV